MPRALTNGSACSEALFDYDNKLTAIAGLEAKMAEPDFWNQSEKAQQTVGDLKALRNVVQPLREATTKLSDIRETGRDGRR